MTIGSSGLISTQNISKHDILFFFNQISKQGSQKLTFQNAVGVLAFFEPSTRTRVSFEAAGLSLGIRWIHLSPEQLSLKKGETLKDTFQTLALYQPDFLVIRHGITGVPHQIQEWTKLPVISAGDGINEHPTQALLDAFTLYERSASKKWRISFFGDVVRSRVARSNIHLFKTLGWPVSICDDGSAETKVFAEAFDLKLIARKNLKTSDVVYALRVQKERGSVVDQAPLNFSDLGTKTLLMHPGPVIHGEDLSHELCDFDLPQSLIHRQVANGLKIRRQILINLLSDSTSKKHRGGSR